jgi:hypothetical protein
MNIKAKQPRKITLPPTTITINPGDKTDPCEKYFDKEICRGLDEIAKPPKAPKSPLRKSGASQLGKLNAPSAKDPFAAVRNTVW